MPGSKNSAPRSRASLALGRSRKCGLASLAGIALALSASASVSSSTSCKKNNFNANYGVDALKVKLQVQGIGGLSLSKLLGRGRSASSLSTSRHKVDPAYAYARVPLYDGGDGEGRATERGDERSDSEGDKGRATEQGDERSDSETPTAAGTPTPNGSEPKKFSAPKDITKSKPITKDDFDYSNLSLRGVNLFNSLLTLVDLISCGCDLARVAHDPEVLRTIRAFYESHSLTNIPNEQERRRLEQLLYGRDGVDMAKLQRERDAEPAYSERRLVRSGEQTYFRRDGLKAEAWEIYDRAAQTVRALDDIDASDANSALDVQVLRTLMPFARAVTQAVSVLGLGRGFGLEQHSVSNFSRLFDELEIAAPELMRHPDLAVVKAACSGASGPADGDAGPAAPALFVPGTLFDYKV